jgi:hypothetical protein
MGAFNRTNRNNSFYQLRETVRAFSEVQSRTGLGDGTFNAVVLYASLKTVASPTGPSWTGSFTDPLLAPGWSPPKYKIYFRVPDFHKFLPLPPSFRNIIIPGPNRLLNGSNTGSNRLSCLEPAAEEELLISAHPHLWIPISAEGPTPARLNPGDIILVRFKDGKFENAEFVGVVQQGLNIIDHSKLIDPFNLSGLFDGQTEDVGDKGPGPGAGWFGREINTNFPEQFSLENMLRNSGNLANLPNDKQFDSLQLLVEKVLDPIQTKLNEQGLGEIYITSGFRNEEVNKKAGGVKNSKHTFGYTTDMRKPAKFADAYEFSQWIVEQEIDWRGQLIWYDVNKGGHVHIDYIENSSEKKYLHGYGPTGTTLYEPGQK